MSRVRVGVLGCGMIAQLMHLPYLAELDDRFEIVALCDQAADLAGRVAERFGVKRTYEAFDDMLNDIPDLDAVVILNRDHFASALTALDRGLHVFTEKPLCYTLAETERLVATSERTGAKLMVGYMKRYDGGVRRGIEEIRRIETPRMARVHVLVGPDYGNWIIPELRSVDRPDGPLDTSDADGRLPKVMAELGSPSETMLAAYMDMLGVWSHDINVYRAAFPSAPASIKTNVSADGTVLSALLRYHDGFQCVFEGVATDVHCFEETLTVWGGDRTVTLDISNPFLRHVPSTVTIQENEPAGPDGRGMAVARTIEGPHAEPFKEQLRHFHECVTTPGLAPLTSGREALEDTRLMSDIIRAISD
jgi:predicted dehydrogenase